MTRIDEIVKSQIENGEIASILFYDIDGTKITLEIGDRIRYLENGMELKDKIVGFKREKNDIKIELEGNDTYFSMFLQKAD